MGLHSVPQVETSTAVGRRPHALVGPAEQLKRILGRLPHQFLGGDLDVVGFVLGCWDGTGADGQNREGKAYELE